MIKSIRSLFVAFSTVACASAFAGNLTVNLAPSAAVSAGAQWRVDGGAWKASGATIKNLSNAAHTVDYKAVTGWGTPSPTSVTLVNGVTTTITGTYSPPASLMVTLTPSTGQWRVDRGVWRNSGTTATGLTAGAHSISYSSLTGYMAPATETVTLVSGQTTNVARAYTALSSLVVTLTPSTASWQLDNGAWLASGTTVPNLNPGAHSIAYSSVANMLAPPDETVILPSGQTTSIARSYTPAGQIFVMLTPNTAQWRVDSGQWRATNTSSGLVAAGSHTIDYSSLPSMLTPPSETVSVTASQTLNISKLYTAESGLIITLLPAVGQWRVDGGAWRNSGDRAGQLVAGNHAVEYTAAAGYTAPPSETVFLSTGSDQTLSRSYLLPASATVNVVPSSGQWRLHNGAWQVSGATVTGLRPGNYAVEFASVPGWFDIPSYGITLAENESKTVTYQHVREAAITTTLSPGNALWRINGGAWQPSGTTVGALYAGNYTIDYSAVADLTTPASQSFYLASGEQKSISLSYSGPSSLTVNLSPGAGQWRVDGGGWQASGNVAFNLALGAHQIEYAPLSGYLAPASETVSFRQNQSFNLTRTYQDATGAYLQVKTVPGYLSDTGVAKWRVDGGVWNAAGAPVSVAPGSHTLEFQPVAGLDVPPATSVTTSTGAVETIEATYYMPHRLRFFLHPNLVTGLSAEVLQARLSQYATHLQTIWNRESLRRLTFNPATDITITSTTPFSGSATPPLPEYGFELWAHADWASVSSYGSNGGSAALDSSGAGGADGMHWTQIYDPSTLAPGSTELFEYWKQINAMVHEFEHVFGAGLGEYYSASGFSDATGVTPLDTVDYFAPADPFWNAHPDFWADPLLRNAWDNYRTGNPTALPDLLAGVHFSGTSRGIVNGCYRNADSPFTTRTALPDLSRIRITVVDSNSGQPIPTATLRIWNRPNPGPTSSLERTVVTTGTPGVFEFNWTADSSFVPLNNWDNGKLLKAFADGYQPKAQWQWIYDAQRVKTVDNSDTWTLTIALDPVP